MEKIIEKIEIPYFIKIRILELNNSNYVYFVEEYNKKYFYIKEDNKLCTHQAIDGIYDLYFQKAEIIYRNNLNKLEKDIYNLYSQLTFKIERAEKNTKYYAINAYFEVIDLKENNTYLDNILYKSFNYFVSKEKAEKYAKKLQEYLIESRKKDCVNGE